MRRPAVVMAGVLLGSGAGLYAQELEAPREVLAGGKPISVDVGYVAPFIMDWDGDGRDDLLVGQFGYGKMRIYRNVGSKTKPEYAGFKWFRAGGATGRVPTG